MQILKGTYTEAKKLLTAEPVRERLNAKGIYSSSLPIDELPEAYKSSKMIEEAITPTATIINKIKPMVSFKTKS